MPVYLKFPSHRCHATHPTCRSRLEERLQPDFSCPQPLRDVPLLPGIWKQMQKRSQSWAMESTMEGFWSRSPFPHVVVGSASPQEVLLRLHADVSPTAAKEHLPRQLLLRRALKPGVHQSSSPTPDPPKSPLGTSRNL